MLKEDYWFLLVFILLFIIFSIEVIKNIYNKIKVVDDVKSNNDSKIFNKISSICEIVLAFIAIFMGIFYIFKW